MRRIAAASIVLASLCSCLFGMGGNITGSGTEADPYLIEDFSDLTVFANPENADKYWSRDVYTQLAADIDLDPALPGRITYLQAVISAVGSDSGSDDIMYGGFFDGNSHKIKNLTINTYSDLDETNDSNGYLGLFGMTDPCSTITGLIIENAQITGGKYEYRPNHFHISSAIGALCGLNGGTITNCRANGVVHGMWSSGILCGDNSGTISGCTVTGTIDSNEAWHLGGLCGRNYGSIRDSNANCIVNSGLKADEVGILCGTNSSIISNCLARGSITCSDSDRIGGISGENDGTITRCISASNITADARSYQVGGFCGENNGTILESYASGTVRNINMSWDFGGFCGENYGGLIKNCYSTGKVIGGQGPYYYGGMCGYNRDGRIVNSFSNAQVIIGDDSGPAGGFCGYYMSGKITGCFWDTQSSGIDISAGGYGLSTNELMHETTFIGWNDGNWVLEEGSDYPHLLWEGTPGELIDYEYPASYSGSGEELPFQLRTADDIISLTRRPADWDKRFILMNDIDMAGIVLAKAIDEFGGILDGRSHRIDNLTIDAATTSNSICIGLFGQLNPGGIITNLCLNNLTIQTIDMTYTSVGGLCGNNYGLLDNCSVIFKTGLTLADDATTAGIVCGGNYGIIDSCFASGFISSGQGSKFLGGICGSNYGTVTKSISTSNIHGDTDSQLLGGLCGYNNISGDIRQSYATGNVTGTAATEYLGGLFGKDEGGTISACYATGMVSGGDNSKYLGGLCGQSRNGTINNCYATGAVTGGDNAWHVSGFCGFSKGANITNCYATGQVTAGEGAWSINGFSKMSGGTIENCFWDYQASGMATSAAGTGKTTSAMQTQGLFIAAGWDFVWEADNGSEDIWHTPYKTTGYPMLWWQRDINGDLAGCYGVNLADFSFLAANWLLDADMNLRQLACDINHDGIIDSSDLLEMAANWLEGTDN